MLRIGLRGDGGPAGAAVGGHLRRLRDGLGAARSDADIAIDDLVGPDVPPGLNLVVGVVGRSGPSAQGPDVDVWLDGTTSPARRVQAVETLWTDRLLPFEANLRLGRRARRRMRAVIVDPDPTWPDQAARLIGRLDHAIGRSAIRIDHIGSTSVPGLPAKDLVDIQVTVADLSTARDAAERARTAGFVLVAGEWSGPDRHGCEHPEHVVVDADPGRPVNVNIRSASTPVWRETLLFRDWLRAHPDERDAYTAMKRALADGPENHVDDYGRAKRPSISAALDRAEGWAARSRWHAPDG